MLIPRKHGRVSFGELRSLIELCKSDPLYVGRIIYGLLTHSDPAAGHYTVESLRGVVYETLDLGELVRWFVGYGHWFYTWVKSIDQCPDELIIDFLSRVALCIVMDPLETTSAGMGFQEGVDFMDFESVWCTTWDCYYDKGGFFTALVRLRSQEELSHVRGLNDADYEAADLNSPPTSLTFKDIQGPIDAPNESFNNTPYQPSKGFEP
jgi:hypothetical protein